MEFRIRHLELGIWIISIAVMYEALSSILTTNSVQLQFVAGKLRILNSFPEWRPFPSFLLKYGGSTIRQTSVV